MYVCKSVCVYVCMLLALTLVFSADSCVDCVLLPSTSFFFLHLSLSLSAHTFILCRSIRSVASTWHREWRGTWEGCFVICQVVPPTGESQGEGEWGEWNWNWCGYTFSVTLHLLPSGFVHFLRPDWSFHFAFIKIQGRRGKKRGEKRGMPSRQRLIQPTLFA